MKHSKWLLNLILVLLGINIIFYLVWYAFDIQGMVKSKLERYISAQIGGTLSIQKLAINERHITISQVKFRDKAGDINLNVRQIQVSYNLLRILTSGFKITKAINKVDIYNPDLSLILRIKPPKPDSKPFKLPDLTTYFQQVNINQGKVYIDLSLHPGIQTDDTLRIVERLRDVNINAINDKTTHLKLTSITANSGKVTGEAELDKGLVTSINAQVQQFKPNKVELTDFSNLSTEISVLFDYTKINRKAQPSYNANAILWNTTARYDKYHLQIPYLQLEGNDKSARFTISESSINKSHFSAAGYLLDILRKPYLSSSVTLAMVDLNDIIPDLTGTATGKASIRGQIPDLEAEAAFSLPTAVIFGESFDNVELKAFWKDKSLQFSTGDSSWRNQSWKATGNLDLTESKLSVNLITHPDEYGKVMNLKSAISANLDFRQGIKAKAEFQYLDFYNDQVSLLGFTGSAVLDIADSRAKIAKLTLEAANDSGISVNGWGNPLTQRFEAYLNLDNVRLDDSISPVEANGIKALLSGRAHAIMDDMFIKGEASLAPYITAPKLYTGDIQTTYSLDLKSMAGQLSLSTEHAEAAKVPFNLDFELTYAKDKIGVKNFKLDDVLSLEGKLNLKDIFASSFSLELDSLVLEHYANLLPIEQSALPVSAQVSCALDYNAGDSGLVEGIITSEAVSITSLHPFSVRMLLNGNLKRLEAHTMIVANQADSISITGHLTHNNNVEINAFSNIMALKLQNIVDEKQLSGVLSGLVEWKGSFRKGYKPDHEFGCNLEGGNVAYAGYRFRDITLRAAQTNQLLKLDTLFVNAVDEIQVSGSGALDYNLITGNKENAGHQLDLELQGDALKILKTFVPYFETAKGFVTGKLTLSAGEDGISCNRGFLSMKSGILRLKDQPEAIHDIVLEAKISDNQLKINKCISKIGNGKLYIRNAIDSGDDNFFIGPINLGYLLVRTNAVGIQVSVPDYLPANTVATAVLKGQNAKEATLKGPFDDMKIVGEVIASNGSVLYPPNTKNLLQMLNLFQTPLPIEQLPLPFRLDLMIRTGDNIHYITYPAHLTCMPGSFLRITYDGMMWNAPEASFSSEKGTLDFYGTVFNCEKVNLEINALNNIITVNGLFTKKASDGTLITLSVRTNPQKGSDITTQLEFKLTSDNPQDKTSTQILSRLRYNRSIDELSPDQRQSLLQDEAMQLVSTSVSTTYVSQFLSPVENKIRRFLKLDSFSISTGFVQNLFVEVTNRDQSGSTLSNPGNVNSDILQFSSSVLLNNLSLSMGKYLGNSLFVDYEILLQESTGLANQTKLDLYHNASIRFNLPLKLKFVYTFSLKPAPEINSHEVMLQRSFRF